MTWFAVAAPRPQVRVLGPEDLPGLGVPRVPQIVVSPAARRSIGCEVTWRGGAELESGGGLFGTASGNRIVVTHAGTPGPNAERGPSTFRFDGSEWSAGPLATPQALGDWHSHPYEEVAEPSPTDIRSWRAGSRATDGPYVGVIVTKGPRSWGKPTLSAWLVRSPNSDPEPADVLESTT